MAMKLRNRKLIPQLRNTLKNQSGDKNEKMLVDKNSKVQAQISPSTFWRQSSSKQQVSIYDKLAGTPYIASVSDSVALQLSIYDRWGMDGEISGRL